MEQKENNNNKLLENTKNTRQQNQSSQNNQFSDKIKGCWMGVLLGDALGAVLEFKPNITKQDISNSLNLPGGGVHKVGNGQITDDGELSLCLAKGLVQGQGVLNLNKIASRFGDWFVSKPFDVGNTIRRAVPKAINLQQHQAEMIRRGANNKESQKSISNGSMMLIAPLACWAYKLEENELFIAVKEITILTHPNQTVFIANLIYILIIKYLIQGNNNQESIIKAQTYIENNFSKFDYGKEVLQWIQDSVNNILPNPTRNQGFVKIAFTYSINYLYNYKNENYLELQTKMLSLGGDTDTNCAIFGGIIGALLGFENLPKEQVNIVLSNKGKKFNRPDFLKPSVKFEKLIQKIIEISPEKLEIIGGSQEYLK